MTGMTKPGWILRMACPFGGSLRRDGPERLSDGALGLHVMAWSAVAARRWPGHEASGLALAVAGASGGGLTTWLRDAAGRSWVITVSSAATPTRPPAAPFTTSPA